MANPYVYFPASYQQQIYNPFPAQMQQMQQMQNAQQNPPQIQNGGFISVRSEEEARNYPVAPGNSVTFKNETAPFVYTKTMGFSQLDRPVFDKYRLVKEQDIQQDIAQNQGENKQGIDLSAYALKSDLAAIYAEIDTLKGELSKGKQAKVKKSEEIVKRGEDDE